MVLPPTPPGPTSIPGSKGRKGKIISIGISVSAFIVIGLLGCCIHYQRTKARTNKGENHVKLQDFPSIKLDLIHAATKHFSKENKLGQGGFGPVYKVLKALMMNLWMISFIACHIYMVT
ncbi:G-type lectin S-receptor-like serine/threonine-protein kinase [Camellia lanceoleosa]|uniref:G-type lectin S-receptor-like serine/threonine-protein kinase n=1 Tax=Camellia lanceoleosa TaxID=1840588 RepID=A0ACC0GGW1_9ERIC|nr:G-type lectin S-receptor-like serine/threonine-protein kinase [Camellia lanceoleosa]